MEKRVASEQVLSSYPLFFLFLFSFLRGGRAGGWREREGRGKGGGEMGWREREGERCREREGERGREEEDGGSRGKMD